MNNLKKIISIVLLFAFMSVPLFAPFSCNAGVWGEAAASQVVDNLWEFLQAQIISMLLAVLKTAAVQMINSSVNNLISSSGAPLFITNWKDQLIIKPAERTAIRSIDLLGASLRGKASGSTYQSRTNNPASGNYSTRIKNSTVNVIFGNSKKKNNDELAADPQNMYDEDSNRPANAYFPRSIFIELNDHKKKTKAIHDEEKLEAQIEGGVGDGFLGVPCNDDTADICAPAKVIAETKYNSDDLGNKIIAGAGGIFEVIAASVTKMLVSQVKKGIGNVKNNVQKEVTSTVGKFKKDAAKSTTPDRQFKPNY